jgi:threonine/homoserine/homoserine lactone efflux protein
MQGWENWVNLLFGIIFIAIGLAYIFSRRFTDFALGMTSQGAMWVRWLGPRWAKLVARSAFGAISIAFGAYVIYVAFNPWRAS